MKEFIDLEGASGARYRFRLWPEGAAHTPIAGHYAYLRQEWDGFLVLAVGATDNLAQLDANWRAARERGATHRFTRLNISRAIREAEQQDLEAMFTAGPEVIGEPRLGQPNRDQPGA